MWKVCPSFAALIDFKLGCAGKKKQADNEDDDEEEEEEEEEEEDESGAGGGFDDEDEDEDEEDDDEDDEDEDEDETANLTNGIGKLQKRRGPTKPVRPNSKKADKVTSFA